MKSPSISIRNRTSARSARAGFTLIEILVVVSLLALIAGFGLSFSFDSYRGYLFRAEYTGVTHIIAKARNQSVNNFNESQYGVKFLADEYVLFEGDDYDTSDVDTRETYKRNPSFEIEGIDVIVFEQLSGDIDTDDTVCDADPCVISFNNGGVRVQNVTVYENGGIIW